MAPAAHSWGAPVRSGVCELTNEAPKASAAGLAMGRIHSHGHTATFNFEFWQCSEQKDVLLSFDPQVSSAILPMRHIHLMAC
ncbi:hypothetical protein EYF80_005900 [Liparis tanakae]|uniref:Uncharacterized protein n=1 Tax=Liparis tanakae TaxID=230148 RepID=A0A4Z2J1N4_9TELE|nr:hypothetical protein EYF80_005900 [Liparis tanakae]